MSYKKHAELTVNVIDMALKVGKKVNPDEGFRLCAEALKLNKPITVIIKVKNKEYSNWYNKQRPKEWTETLEEETLYITTGSEKAFNSSMLGYSIFATSLAEYKRAIRIKDTMAIADRIEMLNYDWFIILED